MELGKIPLAAAASNWEIKWGPAFRVTQQKFLNFLSLRLCPLPKDLHWKAGVKDLSLGFAIVFLSGFGWAMTNDTAWLDSLAAIP